MKKISILILTLVLSAACCMAGSAQRTKKATAKKAVAAKFDPTVFTGTWANSYSDHIGGVVTDTLALLYDEATGKITGEYKTETGQVKVLNGKVTGREAELTDADGDAFAGMKLYNNSTLKLDVFTGTFKRVDTAYRDLNAHPDAPEAQPASAAASAACKQPVEAQCDSCKTGAQCPDMKAGAACPNCKAGKGTSAQPKLTRKQAAEAVLKAAAAGRPVPTP